MTQASHELLKHLVEQMRDRDYPFLPLDKYFELFAAQQVIKERRYDLDPDEIESGIIGGDGDGGIDGFYIFANRKLVREDTDISVFEKQQINVELVIVQAKNKPSFEESVPIKMKDFIENCLKLGADPQTASVLYSEALRDAVRLFHSLYTQALIMQPTLTVRFFHVTHADHIDTKVLTRGEQVSQLFTSLFPTATCSYVPVKGSDLIKWSNRRPERILRLKPERQLDWNSFQHSAYLCVVKITDFYSFITEDGVLRTSIFEANVRDHAPDVRVNQGIATSLHKPNGDDFWWLNNGITIIASNVAYQGGDIHVKNQLIVNGLQTSYEIYAHFSTKPRQEDQRVIMVKVLSNEDADSVDRIISATNSQTKIESISLHATEQVHRNIEVSLKSYGFFYDRRKNFYRNQGAAASKVITIPYMAQAVAAVVLQQPDQARARPGTVAEKNYKALFSEDHPPNLYPACINIMKRVESFFDADEERRNYRLNLVFYVALYATCRHLNSVKPKRPRIASVDSSEITNATLAHCFSWVVREYERLGATDKVAKGPMLASLLRNHLISEFGGKKNGRAQAV